MALDRLVIEGEAVQLGSRALEGGKVGSDGGDVEEGRRGVQANRAAVLLAASFVYYLVWMTYLQRSTRVRETLGVQKA